MTEMLVHQCIVQEGDAAGNTHRQDVTYTDVLLDEMCDVCGEPLATLREVVAHIYLELVK